MEKMEGESLTDITCKIMPEIVKKVCGDNEKFSKLNFEQISSEAISAVRTREIDLLSRDALEERILEIATAKLKKN